MAAIAGRILAWITRSQRVREEDNTSDDKCSDDKKPNIETSEDNRSDDEDSDVILPRIATSR